MWVIVDDRIDDLKSSAFHSDNDVYYVFWWVDGRVLGWSVNL